MGWNLSGSHHKPLRTFRRGLLKLFVKILIFWATLLSATSTSPGLPPLRLVPLEHHLLLLKCYRIFSMSAATHSKLDFTRPDPPLSSPLWATSWCRPAPYPPPPSPPICRFTISWHCYSTCMSTNFIAEMILLRILIKLLVPLHNFTKMFPGW